jgi:hypothetical protein
MLFACLLPMRLMPQAVTVGGVLGAYAVRLESKGRHTVCAYVCACYAGLSVAKGLGLRLQRAGLGLPGQGGRGQGAARFALDAAMFAAAVGGCFSRPDLQPGMLVDFLVGGRGGSFID